MMTAVLLELAFLKSQSQFRKRDWYFECLDPSLKKGVGDLKKICLEKVITALKILQSVLIAKPHFTITF